MWYLNFCSPFIYDTTGSSQTIRYVLVTSLLIQLLVYIIFVAKYRLFGLQKQLKSDPKSIKATINKVTCTTKKKLSHTLALEKYILVDRQREYRLDLKSFKEWYLHYFGLHSIAVGGCIMYSPYPATVAFAIIQLCLFMIATGMQSCVIAGTAKVIYYIVMIVMVLMDVLLLFSISMGVGASGYNPNTKNCYLLE